MLVAKSLSMCQDLFSVNLKHVGMVADMMSTKN